MFIWCKILVHECCNIYLMKLEKFAFFTLMVGLRLNTQPPMKYENSCGLTNFVDCWALYLFFVFIPTSICPGHLPWCSHTQVAHLESSEWVSSTGEFYRCGISSANVSNVAFPLWHFPTISCLGWQKFRVCWVFFSACVLRVFCYAKMTFLNEWKR